jgi:hypothetical protein
MSYLQYLNKASSVVRSALKEPMRTAAAGRSEVKYTKATWENGVRGERGKQPFRCPPAHCDRPSPNLLANAAGLLCVQSTSARAGTSKLVVCWDHQASGEVRFP